MRQLFERSIQGPNTTTVLLSQILEGPYPLVDLTTGAAANLRETPHDVDYTTTNRSYPYENCKKIAYLLLGPN